MLQQVPRDTDAATDGKRCGKRVRCLVSLTFLCGSVLGSWKTLESVAMFFSPDSANKDVLILLNRCEALSTRPLVLACAYVAMVLGFGLLMCISFFRMRGNTDDIDVSDVYPIASVILLAWSLVVHPQSIAEDFQSMMSFRLDSPRPLLTWLIPVFLILLLLSNQPICNLHKCRAPSQRRHAEACRAHNMSDAPSKRPVPSRNGVLPDSFAVCLCAGQNRGRR